MNLYIAFSFIFFLIIVHKLIYFFITFDEKNITVHKKYTSIVNGNVNYNIIDEKKTNYLLSSDLFISSKKCNEIWDNIMENELIKIKYYGLNCPLLDLHFKIVDKSN